MSTFAKKTLRELAPILGCALAGFIVFQFFGNATRGYIKTNSLFFWWGKQWLDPASESEHGPLVLLVSLFLFLRNLRAQPREERFAPGLAAALLVVGLGLHLLGYAAQQTRLSIAALLIFLEGSLLMAGGWRWARAAIFPLGFLLLAVPVNFLDSLGYYLRLGVVETVAPLVRGLGVEVIRSGTQLFAPDGRYQYDVAAACSGVRSLIALLALALLVGYLEFRRVWARALLVALSIPCIFAGNLLRIAAIVLAGERGGRAAGERVHEWSGYLVFVIVLGLLFAAVALLRRLAPEAAAKPSRHSLEKSSAERPRSIEARTVRALAGSATFLTVFVAAIAVVLVTRKLDQLPLRDLAGVKLSSDGSSPAELPAFLGTEWIGQRAEVTPAEREILPPDTGYSRRNYVAVADGRRQVFFSVVLSGRDRSSIHRPELCLGGQGWTIERRSEHEFTAGKELRLPATILEIEREELEGPNRAKRIPSLLAYWFVSADEVVPTHGEMLWRSAVDRLLKFRGDRWAYIVMQTSVADGGEEASLARMQEVFAAVWPQICTPSK